MASSRISASGRPGICKKATIVSEIAAPPKEEPDPVQHGWLFPKLRYLTKWTEAFASSDAKAITVAKLFMEKLVIHFGCPLEILTDRGKNFQSKLLLEISNIHKISTSSYHPETNGLVERFNRTLCNMLAMNVAKRLGFLATLRF